MNYEVKDFSIDVLQASFDKPVLVDFWAEWCGPCRVLGPILEKLVVNNNDEWSLVKVNSDENPELSAQYGIRSIPNVKLFDKGEVIDEFVGALPEQQIIEWLKKSIPNKYQDLLTNAETLFLSGKENEAQKMLDKLLLEDPNNSSAKLLLARILLFRDNAKVSDLINTIEETNENSEIIGSLKTIIDLLNEDKNSLLKDSPVKNLYLEAVNHLKEKRYDLSLEKFIEIIRTDK
ncbi:MAG TPA: thioredoxin, partial [Ignavibacteriales bacterium]|nr:thioredoxin [Ignavibacteriales bacterium]